MSRKLLFSITKKDFDIHWFSGKGAGGQKRNKTQNCLRLHHRASGAMVTGQSHKERPANQREAMENLRENVKFKLWYTEKVNEMLSGVSLEEKVEKSMSPENIKTEGKDENGKWVELGVIKQWQES